MEIITGCEQPGACLASVARQHDVSSGPLWNWRRQARRGLLRVELAPIFLPVPVTVSRYPETLLSDPRRPRFHRGRRCRLIVRSPSC
jgi:transposase-like protein